MGTILSTLSEHVFRMNMTPEVMIGLVLAIPFFLQYYKEAMDRYATEKGRRVILGRIEQNEQKVVLRKHRTLMCGTIPDLVPSSQDSVSTAVASNTAKAVQSRALVEDHVFVLPRMVTVEQQSEDECPPSPLKSPSTAQEVGTPLVSEHDASSSPVESVSMDSNDYEDSTLDSPAPSEALSTKDYLESIARTLSKKARDADHADKVGIAQALMELGDILAKEEKNAAAMRVFKRAELVQRMLIEETIAAVALAMDQQAKLHQKHGNRFLARVYGNMAKELQIRPSPTNLKMSIQLHHQHKLNHESYDSKELKSLNKKLDRRIKRASAEAMPIVLNLKAQAQCSTALLKDTELRN